MLLNLEVFVPLVTVVTACGAVVWKRLGTDEGQRSSGPRWQQPGRHETGRPLLRSRVPAVLLSQPPAAITDTAGHQLPVPAPWDLRSRS